jgi:hypothetical protein
MMALFYQHPKTREHATISPDGGAAALRTLGWAGRVNPSESGRGVQKGRNPLPGV